MAIKKSDLYSSIWASCDELRGGMDASQYKDYVLFMLFIKYVSDKYAHYDGFEPPIVIPQGASFRDMVALKGDADIGNKINTQVIQPLIDSNTRLARSDFPDFNDPNKLGDDQARVESLGNLIAIFENPLPLLARRASGAQSTAADRYPARGRLRPARVRPHEVVGRHARRGGCVGAVAEPLSDPAQGHRYGVPVDLRARLARHRGVLRRRAGHRQALRSSASVSARIASENGSGCAAMRKCVSSKLCAVTTQQSRRQTWKRSAPQRKKGCSQ